MVEGEQLADRPTPEHVLDAMSDGGDYPGRWVDAGDLRVGDVLLLRDGRQERVERIAARQSVETLYNFAVDDLHNYAVGNLGVLVHNNCTVHGNSKGSTRPATLYELYDDQGNLLKHGITQDINKRYTKKFMADKDIIPIDIGTRVDMLLKERNRVMQNPGPLNREPWAGILP